MSNRIPRKFDRITGKMLIDTNMDKINDVIHIYKNNSVYLALNTRTNKYAYIFPTMLRTSEVIEITEII